MRKDIVKFAFLVVVLLLSSCEHKPPFKINRNDLIGFWKLEEYCDITLNRDSTFKMNNLPRDFCNKEFNYATDITIYGKWKFIEEERDNYRIEFSIAGTTKFSDRYFNAIIKYMSIIIDGNIVLKINNKLYYYLHRENKVRDYDVDTYAYTNGKSYGNLKASIFDYKDFSWIGTKHVVCNNVFEKGEYYVARRHHANTFTDGLKREIDLTEPLIKDIREYDKSTAILQTIEKSFNMRRVSFSYLYHRVNYKRSVYIKDVKSIKLNSKIKIIVNKKNPKISYIEGTYKNIKTVLKK